MVNMLSTNVLTKFEIARIISARTLQISTGAPILVSAKKSDRSIDIAKREFEKGLIPISVKRELFDKKEVEVDMNKAIKFYKKNKL